MTLFFDAHCHINANDAALSGPLRLSGGNGRLLCGVSPDDWPGIASLAPLWPGTIPAFGLHPWQAARQQSDWPGSLLRLLRAHPEAWVGEIGLDGLKTALASETEQEKAFICQLDIARRENRPVNLHCIQAHDRLLALLDSHYLSDGARPFIVHAFNGPHQYIGRLCRRGAYFSIGPLSSRKDTRRIQSRTLLLPRDRILLESDAFLRPGIDEEEDLSYTLHWLAELRQEKEQDVFDQITVNSQRIRTHA